MDVRGNDLGAKPCAPSASAAMISLKRAIAKGKRSDDGSGTLFVQSAYERVRGTPEGDATSERVNGDLRNKTRTCAVVDHLKRPPRGLEEVAREHLRRLRGPLLDAAKRDLGPAASRATKRAAGALVSQLALAFGADDAPEPPTKRSRGSSEED